MKNLLSILAICLTLFASACSDHNDIQKEQVNPYEAKMNECMNTLLKSRDQIKGMWPDAGWWNSANLLTAVIRYADVSGQKEELVPVIQDIFKKTRKFPLYNDKGELSSYCENYINDYYDDEAWWALAWIEAYKLTKDTEYLKMAKTIFEDMKTGWSDDVHGGGIFWKKNPLEYKNSIANNLFALTAIRLFKTTHNEDYAKWFEKEVDWYLGTGMYNTELNIIEDGMDGKTNKPNTGGHYTYNQGVAIAVLTEMYLYKNDNKYLQLAETLANSCITKHMVTEDGILREMNTSVADSNDGVQFKGIFMRHLSFLYSVTNKAQYKDFMLKNAESILANDYDANSKSFGCYWYGPFKKVNTAANSSALECVIEAYAMTK